MTAPWLDDGDVALYHGDACDVLRSLPAESVQTCITSPPYWGLRDYGTGSWTGGDPGCDHRKKNPAGVDQRTSTLGHKGAGLALDNAAYNHGKAFGEECGRCGARRTDAQLGLEATPAAYVAALVAVFAEVWRVLRADGTCWINLGDSYTSGDFTRQGKPRNVPQLPNDWAGTELGGRGRAAHANAVKRDLGNLKAKDLVGIPWKVAFALQEAGWYLRSDVIWSKPNPMPESVTDRPTKAHEYVFLLAKQPRYYYDADAVREPHSPDGRAQTKHLHGTPNSHGNYDNMGNGNDRWPGDGRNARSVWEIATQPTPEAHFATFPEAIARRCILAGSSEAGGCSVCGAPWQRQTERERPPGRDTRTPGAHTPTGNGKMSGAKMQEWLDAHPRQTTGWAASCQCGAPPVPQTVLDPFMGSGTTALVARKHGRRAIGVDLSADYLAIAARRLGQQSLFALDAGGVA